MSADPIFARASVRQFTGEPVTDEQVETLLRAAMAAPSACNQQPWEFYVTRDADVLAKLAQASPYAKPTAGAACAIVPCARTEGLVADEYVPQDLGAAVENILVEAVELGLGTVWMGIAPIEERMRAVAQVVGAPAELAPFAIIAVGHPAAPVEPRGPERFEPERVHWI